MISFSHFLQWTKLLDFIVVYLDKHQKGYNIGKDWDTFFLKKLKPKLKKLLS